MNPRERKRAIIDELQRRASSDYGHEWFTEVKEWSDGTWVVKVVHSESGAELSNGLTETWRDVWVRETDGDIRREIRYLPLEEQQAETLSEQNIRCDVLGEVE